MAADDPESTSAPHDAETSQPTPGSQPSPGSQVSSGPQGSPGPQAAVPLSGSPEPAQAEVVGLLVKAVATLPDAERDQVYAWFLDRGITGSQGGTWAGPGPLPRQLREMSAT